ncbi:MAG: transglutaminase domain-containing protein [Cyanobacteria bacterium J06560_2]
MASSEQVSLEPILPSSDPSSDQIQSAQPLTPTVQAAISSRSTVRPIGAYQLSGLTVNDQQLLAVDTVRGYLIEVCPENDNTTILNPHTVKDWIGSSGLAVSTEAIWFTRDECVYRCDRQTLLPEVFVRLSHEANGVAIWENSVYVTCQGTDKIYIFDLDSAERTGQFPQPGIGPENITISDSKLWVCDQEEQTVYCLDKETGEIQLSALTPFPSPTGITFLETSDDLLKGGTHEAGENSRICYLSYANEEAYIRDDPNAESPYQLTFRDRTFIHPFYVHQPQGQPYTLSNGYLVEISYVEELLPLESVPLNNVEWRIALPSNTKRQKVLKVEPVGQPFTIEEQEGQQVAVFKFDHLEPDQAGLVGWKATVELYGLKYFVTPEAVEDAPELSADFQSKYLIDDDELAMDTETIQAAAAIAPGTETNLLRKMLKIRNYVYDQLSYGIQPKIDTPDVALARGVGSCGEYVGVLLALARLNGIACRTIGRYKCPATPEQKGVPLEPDFNHVWLEFYVPGIGWLPMESNVDDVIDKGPYPQRYFMGLSWFHTEIGKGISFEKMKADNKPEHLSLGDLAINHVRFTILEELNPTFSNLSA